MIPHIDVLAYIERNEELADEKKARAPTPSLERLWVRMQRVAELIERSRQQIERAEQLCLEASLKTAAVSRCLHNSSERSA